MPSNPVVETALRQRSPGADAIARSRQRTRAAQGIDYSEFGLDTGGMGGDAGRPGLPELPEFESPEYDEREVSRIASRIAAPQVRKLRETTRTAITRRGPGYENPNVRRMTVRQALQGYGTGLESIISGSRRAAVSEYAPQFEARQTAAKMNYQTRVNAMMAQYGNLWKEYLTNISKPELSGMGLTVESGAPSRPTVTSPVDLNEPGYIGDRPIYRGGARATA